MVRGMRNDGRRSATGRDDRYWRKGGGGVVKFKTPISVHYARARRNHIYVLTPAVGEATAVSGVAGRGVRSAGSGPGERAAPWRHRRGAAAHARPPRDATIQPTSRRRPPTATPTPTTTDAAAAAADAHTQCRRTRRPSGDTSDTTVCYWVLHANSHTRTLTPTRAKVLHTLRVDLSPLLARHVVGVLRHDNPPTIPAII